MPGMKRTTIRKVAEQKLRGLFETVLDKELRYDMEQGTILTGGAITSMLLGEKPNDYDLYFESYELAKRVAEYYVKVYNESTGQLRAINHYVPEVREDTIKNIRGVEEKRILIWMQSAGVAGEDQAEYTYSEWDEEATADFVDSLTPTTIGEAMEVVEAVAADLDPKDKHGNVRKTRYRPVYLTDNAITLSDKVQLIIRFYGSPEEIHDNYDFAHCKCYYSSRTKKVVITEEAMESILTKSLIYKGSLYPVASVLRVRKFINRGWRITAGQMLKMMFQISEADLADPAVLREQLLGVDHAYMLELMSAINENAAQNKGRVDETYLGKLIDQIFEDQ